VYWFRLRKSLGESNANSWQIQWSILGSASVNHAYDGCSHTEAQGRTAHGRWSIAILDKLPAALANHGEVIEAQNETSQRFETKVAAYRPGLRQSHA
jgi:hypothetical protein